MQLLVHKRNYQWSLKPPKNQQKKVIKQQQQQKNPQNWNLYQALSYVKLEGKRMIKENRLSKVMKHIFMRLYFNTEIRLEKAR